MNRKAAITQKSGPVWILEPLGVRKGVGLKGLTMPRLFCKVLM